MVQAHVQQAQVSLGVGVDGKPDCLIKPGGANGVHVGEDLLANIVPSAVRVTTAVVPLDCAS